MPLGAPFQTVPKSGCSPVVRPMLAIRLAEFGSTGSWETSRFQALSVGNTCRPAIVAPPPPDGAGVPPPPPPEGVPLPPGDGVRGLPERALPPPPQPEFNATRTTILAIMTFMGVTILVHGWHLGAATALDPPVLHRNSGRRAPTL